MQRELEADGREQIDGYHGAPLHHTYFEFLASQGDDGAPSTCKPARRARYDLGNGHAVVDYPAPFPRVIARWHPIFGEEAKPEIQAIRDELVDTPRRGARRTGWPRRAATCSSSPTCC